VLAPGTELCRLEDVERLYGEVVLQAVEKSQPASASP
jgi:hypothetical protein